MQEAYFVIMIVINYYYNTVTIRSSIHDKKAAILTLTINY